MGLTFEEGLIWIWLIVVANIISGMALTQIQKALQPKALKPKRTTECKCPVTKTGELVMNLDCCDHGKDL